MEGLAKQVRERTLKASTICYEDPHKKMEKSSGKTEISIDSVCSVFTKGIRITTRDVMLHDDNAAHHHTSRIMDFLKEKLVKLLPHSPYRFGVTLPTTWSF